MRLTTLKTNTEHMKRLNLILIILAILTSCGTTTYIIRKETTYGRIIIYNDRGDTTEVYPYAKLQEDTKTTCITSTGVAIPQSETTDSPLKIGGGFKFYDMNKESYVILSPAIPYKAEYKYTEVKIDTVRMGW